MRVKGSRSLTARLTVLFALASSSVLLAMGLVIGNLVEKHFEEQDVEELNGKLALVGHALAGIEAPQDIQSFDHMLKNSLTGHTGLSVAVLGPKGDVVFSSMEAGLPQEVLTHLSQSGKPSHALNWTANGIPFRGITAVLPTGIAQWPALPVAIAMDISMHRHFMDSFSETLWAFVIGATFLTGFLGWIVARQGLSPLHAMREKAAAVTAQHLHQRLPADSVPSELAELAQTLNEMLERLEEAFRRLSDFSSDIAHELRTPISALMTQTQVTLSRVRTADEYRENLESNAEEFDRLARMISDMLFLAKADNGLAMPRSEIVDLKSEISALIEFYELLAGERNIALMQTGEGIIAGDRLMLRRALSNLLSNAIHHSPDNARVTTRLQAEGGWVTVSISNSGQTIPAEHLDRLFDRFYRVDPSRQRHGEGAGLGLAITKSIVVAHGGEIGVVSRDGETTFSFRMPA